MQANSISLQSVEIINTADHKQVQCFFSSGVADTSDGTGQAINRCMRN